MPERLCNWCAAPQALAFLAGANSIFDGDKLLTTANNDRNDDMHMFETLGLRSRPAFMSYSSGNETSRHFAEPTAPQYEPSAAGSLEHSHMQQPQEASACCGGTSSQQGRAEAAGGCCS